MSNYFHCNDLLKLNLLQVSVEDERGLVGGVADDVDGGDLLEPELEELGEGVEEGEGDHGQEEELALVARPVQCNRGNETK